MSLNAYSDGEPTDALSDIAIKPQPGHVNPFIAGARAGRHHALVRGQGAQPAAAAIGLAAGAEHALREARPPAPRSSCSTACTSPTPASTSRGAPACRDRCSREADGSTIKYAAACAAINDPDRSIPVQTVPAATWQGARSTPPCDPQTNPAYDPPRWERFFNLNYAQLAVVSDCTDDGPSEAGWRWEPRSRGASTPTATAPTSTRTSAATSGPSSSCVEGCRISPARTRTAARMPRREASLLVALHRRVAGHDPHPRLPRRPPGPRPQRPRLHDRGQSRRGPSPKRAPANAAWPGSTGGIEVTAPATGTTDSLIMRNMLASPDFAQAIQRVDQPGRERQTMGGYFPRSHYTTTAAFASRGCAGAAG